MQLAGKIKLMHCTQILKKKISFLLTCKKNINRLVQFIKRKKEKIINYKTESRNMKWKVSFIKKLGKCTKIKISQQFNNTKKLPMIKIKKLTLYNQIYKRKTPN